MASPSVCSLLKTVSTEEKLRFAHLAAELGNADAAEQAAGKFDWEITPVEVPQRKKDPIIFKHDEGVRADTTLEALAKLRPAFKKDGTVTPGNASTINDAGAAVVVASGEQVTSGLLALTLRAIGRGTLLRRAQEAAVPGREAAGEDADDQAQAVGLQDGLVGEADDLALRVCGQQGVGVLLTHGLGGDGHHRGPDGSAEDAQDAAHEVRAARRDPAPA